MYLLFHQHSICGFQVKTFQSFSYSLGLHNWLDIHIDFHIDWPSRNGPFLGGFCSYSPKYCLIFLKFWPEVFPNKTNTVLEKSFKILNFGSNGTHPGFQVLVRLGTQFTPRKPKILLKPKISAKTASLGISNNVSPRSQKNHKILVKLSKKNIFGPKFTLSLNWLLGLRQRVIRNPQVAYNRTIYLYFLDAKFQLLGIFCSLFYLEKTTTFFSVQDPIGPF